MKKLPSWLLAQNKDRAERREKQLFLDSRTLLSFFDEEQTVQLEEELFGIAGLGSDQFVKVIEHLLEEGILTKEGKQLTYTPSEKSKKYMKQF